MKIGIDCFLDKQLRDIIENEARIGKCEIQNQDNCFIYDTQKDSYLATYFDDLLNVFTVAKNLNAEDNEKSKYLRQFLKEWNLFSLDENDIHRIVCKICHNRYDVEPKLFDKKVIIRELLSTDEMNKSCILKTYSWESFCYNIKHVNRFHSDYFNETQFKKLLENMVVYYPKNTLSLFRGRICDEDCYDIGYPMNKMGAPDNTKATAGRTNSEGIQCLYLANNDITTFHEVRARDHDHVSIGEFKQVKDLKIIDISLFEEFGPFYNEELDMTWVAINLDIIKKIAKEIAKPMRRFDKVIDYVPTQFICDFIKHLGYDGIKYKSTLTNSGENYAIFNEKSFECKDVKVAKIKEVEYIRSYDTL